MWPQSVPLRNATTLKTERGGSDLSLTGPPGCHLVVAPAAAPYTWSWCAPGELSGRSCFWSPSDCHLSCSLPGQNTLHQKPVITWNTLHQKPVFFRCSFHQIIFISQIIFFPPGKQAATEHCYWILTRLWSSHLRLTCILKWVFICCNALKILWWSYQAGASLGCPLSSFYIHQAKEARWKTSHAEFMRVNQKPPQLFCKWKIFRPFYHSK